MNTRHQAQAIAQMAENLHEYNRGVLAMLGQEDLAVEHALICSTIESLVAKRDGLLPKAELFGDLLEVIAEDVNVSVANVTNRIQEQIETAIQRRNAAWQPIQERIDAARHMLEAADPIGMGQHA